MKTEQQQPHQKQAFSLSVILISVCVSIHAVSIDMSKRVCTSLFAITFQFTATTNVDNYFSLAERSKKERKTTWIRKIIRNRRERERES